MSGHAKTIRLIPAGEFSRWLRDTEAVAASRDGQADVPCGTCTACCRSAMFIHIRPDETRTLLRIPRKLLVPAPGLPKGHVVMGYTDEGRCPMFVDNRCSIYEDRPHACREYDCRAFAATGMAVDGDKQPEIAQRVDEWSFGYETDASREEHRLVQTAAAFLQEKRHLFPHGRLPTQPAGVAALAIRIHRMFADMRDAAEREIIGRIVETLAGA